MLIVQYKTMVGYSEGYINRLELFAIVVGYILWLTSLDHSAIVAYRFLNEISLNFVLEK